MLDFCQPGGESPPSLWNIFFLFSRVLDARSCCKISISLYFYSKKAGPLVVKKILNFREGASSPVIKHQRSIRYQGFIVVHPNGFTSPGGRWTGDLFLERCNMQNFLQKALWTVLVCDRQIPKVTSPSSSLSLIILNWSESCNLDAETRFRWGPNLSQS